MVNADVNLLGKIVFTGMITGHTKWGALYGCQAFILPSHQENFGIAVVEALACAKPVLISDQVNIWKEIELEGGGIIAKDNLEGTMKLLTHFLKLSSAARAEMSEKAQISFLKYFDIHQTVKNLINVFGNK